MGGGFTYPRTNFKISMNFMTDTTYDGGMNSQAYISCRVKGSHNFSKYLFAWIYKKWDNSTTPDTNVFSSGIIGSDNNSTWSLSFLNSNQGHFYLNIRVDANPPITELHFRTS